MASITVRPELGSKIFERRLFMPRSRELEPLSKKGVLDWGTPRWNSFTSAAVSCSGMSLIEFFSLQYIFSEHTSTGPEPSTATRAGTTEFSPESDRDFSDR